MLKGLCYKVQQDCDTVCTIGTQRLGPLIVRVGGGVGMGVSLGRGMLAVGRLVRPWVWMMDLRIYHPR
jgi:hypothetical protein